MRFRFILTLAALLMPAPMRAEESLEAWILQEIEVDEQLISDSITRTNGHDLELLKASKCYIPFFLEAPKGPDISDPKTKASLEELLRPAGFPVGGYVYRLSFKNAPPLYALSAGYWEPGGSPWHSLELGKDFNIDADRVWEGEGGSELYVTMLKGVPPRLVIYGKDGAVTKDQPFDLNAPDFETKWSNTEALYAKGRTTQEMITLAEFLQQKDPAWRNLVLAGNANLRNQQERKTERVLLPKIPPINRTVALAALKKRIEAAK